ncbi:YoaK family protein [Rhizobium sp. SSA_523]|uniref:YoaK family protein n=1 Tax=Rhizobium sp. SSA_523 TaxID=2952477 RepID=UPI0020918B7A|nr:YoaK family protein [Rhizobium sp. SSA_523]MCO5732905.1 YoaK family protein [Rhizobium sp. SSA_523]WKC23479.1 YoaK family protein [Rhizobium sp. SSA_523]
MTRERRRRMIRSQRTWTGLALVAAISFVAGLTDAIGLRLSGDFVSFMTGNTTRAAISIADGEWHHGIVLLGAVAVFVLGNALGIVTAYLVPRRIFGVLGCVALLLALAALMQDEQLRLLRFYCVVLSMGMVNATVEHIEGLPIGLTYVTGALSRLGRGMGRYLMGERSLDWSIQAIPWLGMISGAITGAALGIILADKALFVAAGLALAIALVSLRIRRALHRRFNQRSHGQHRQGQRSLNSARQG